VLSLYFAPMMPHDHIQNGVLSRSVFSIIPVRFRRFEALAAKKNTKKWIYGYEMMTERMTIFFMQDCLICRVNLWKFMYICNIKRKRPEKPRPGMVNLFYNQFTF